VNEHELEQTLREAFAAKADAAVPNHRPLPPRVDAATGHPHRRGHSARIVAPLAAAAAVVAVIGGVLAVTGSSGSDGSGTVAAGSTHPSATASPGRAVRITVLNDNRAQYGVGMPVIAVFSHAPTDARPFARATEVTVNGAPVDARWYFLRSRTQPGALEAHLRPRTYWPAHARVHVSIAARGVSAGTGMSFADSVSLDFTTGAATVAVVDDRAHRMTVTTDGKQLATFPVSLGSPTTPTMRGTKVIIAKKPSVCLDGPGFHECGIEYAQQLSYDGEYLIAAPWNVANIESGVDTSNGCTNLVRHDARALYRMLRVGDVVQYPNTSGAAMPVGAGVADWNVPWSTWRRGGLLPTS
jgi:lipoprotein-anchoring transpeptidase ErfK/SrfK